MAGIHDLTQKLGFSKADPTTQVVDAIFKEFYLPGIRDQLNNKRIVARLFQRNSEHIATDGSYAVIALRTGRNESAISLQEYGRLPKPKKQVYQRGVYHMRYNYARITVTGQAMGSSRTNRGSFIRVLDSEMQGVVQDRQVEDNRIYFGDGGGVLAQADAAGGGVTLQVKNPGGITNPGPGVQYIRPGMLIGFVDALSVTAALHADGGGVTGFEVASVDGATNTITFTTATPAGVLANDPMVRVSWEDVATTDRASHSFLNEPFGLAGIVDSGNPQGIPAGTGYEHLLGDIDATNTAPSGFKGQDWQSAVVDNGGVPQAFHQGMFDIGNDALDIAGDGVVKLWLTTHGIRRQYLHDMVANKRYVNTVSVGDGSFKAVEHNGLPIIVDKDCTRGRVYGLDPSSLFMFTETDYFWMDGDNSVLVRDPDRDIYSATLSRYCECGTDKRNANVLIKDIADS